MTPRPTARMTVMDSSHQVERTERNFVHSERSTPPMVRLPATELVDFVNDALVMRKSPFRSLVA